MDQLLGNMIEMWVDRMDNITQPERRKLSALALLSLLPSDNSFLNPWQPLFYTLTVKEPM
uniref:Importin 11 n=3 Tax=Cercopithecinae TaxID=9528 RepID=A0A2K5NAK8_CERAT